MKKYAPLYESFFMDNPEVLIPLFSSKPDFMILSTSRPMEGYGHHTYVCFDAFATFVAKKGRFFWNGQPITLDCPFQWLSDKIAEYAIERHDDLPPLQGGAVGYFGYEAHHYTEGAHYAPDKMSLPDIVLNFYNSVIIIDERANQHWIVATGAPEKTKSAWLKRAQGSLTSIRNVIHQAPSSSQTKPLPHRFASSLQSNLTKARYIEAVLKMKDAILNGDIFQANLSQQFRARLLEGISPLDLYFKLINVNPAPFSAFITIPNYGAIISASPERFIKLTHRRVETCPIKGTRRRVRDETLDQQLADELHNSEKDRAENTMIVDLMRNDLSKVCEPHSVHVEALCALKSFETVHHLVSHITGRLKVGLCALDLLKATFPPGSITGAPKIRAMEIITELEQQARGPYCGSIGYLSFTGDMDLSVVIRTYFTHHDEVFFNAGGAIVLDSSPEDEYAESMLKARALIEALGILP